MEVTMKKYLFGIFFIIVILAGTSFAQARRVDFSMGEPPEEDCSVPGTCYYVDNAVSSSGDGISWGNAWKSFANIDWKQINPGNIIYISGGTSGKTYNEKLVVRASGTPGNQIKITKGVDAGHNGQVMFDGTGKGGTEAIYIRPSSCVGYVTISNFHFRNWGMTIYVSGLSGTSYSQSGAARGVIIENNNIRIDGRAGIFIQTSDNIIARNNYMTTQNWVNDQTDGIYSQKNRLNLYENNTIIISNQEPTGHDDCIQMFTDTDITVKGNYLEQNNTKTGNAQGIMASSLYGTTTIQDNIIYLKSASSPLNVIATGGGGGTLKILGNTIVSTGGSGYACSIRNFNDPFIKNNIIALTINSGNPVAIYAESRFTVTWKPGNIHNNLLWRSGSAHVASVVTAAGATNYTHANFQAAGANLGGGNFNPQFKNIANRDFTPTAAGVATMSDTGSCVGAVPCEK